MKKVLLIALAIMMVASVSMADEISVFADQQGNACTLNFAGPNLYNAYVVHKTILGATGSQFKVVNSTGVAFSAAVMGGYLAIGDAFTNLSLAYGGCLTGPNIPVVQLSGAIFAAPGSDCGQITIEAAPNTVGILTIDCNFAEIPVPTGPFSLGNSASSLCPCGIVAAEQSTWGKVKSLYR